MSWSANEGSHKAAVAVIREIANTDAALLRWQIALGALANNMNSGVDEARLSAFCSVVALAALNPNDYRDRDESPACSTSQSGT